MTVRASLPLMAEAMARNRARAVPGCDGELPGHAAVLDRRTYGMLRAGGGAGVKDRRRLNTASPG